LLHNTSEGRRAVHRKQQTTGGTQAPMQHAACSMQHKAAQQVYPTLHAEFRKFMPQIPIST